MYFMFRKRKCSYKIICGTGVVFAWSLFLVPGTSWDTAGVLRPAQDQRLWAPGGLTTECPVGRVWAPRLLRGLMARERAEARQY